jgi:hypothetical protein
MGQFKEHGVLLYLAPELYSAFVKLQAAKDLGRSYAGLLPFVVGLHELGFLTEENYLFFKQRYSEPLHQKKPKALTKKELERAQKLKDLEQQFSNVIKQWDTVPEKSKRYHIEKAKKYLHVIPNAEYVLALANGKKLTEKGDSSTVGRKRRP